MLVFTSACMHKWVIPLACYRATLTHSEGCARKFLISCFPINIFGGTDGYWFYRVGCVLLNLVLLGMATAHAHPWTWRRNVWLAGYPIPFPLPMGLCIVAFSFFAGRRLLYHTWHN